jgi:hypothetical protein
VYCDYQYIDAPKPQHRIQGQISQVRNATLLHEKLNIQGDSEGTVSILRGDSIGHCEKKSSYEHVSNSEWLPTYSCLILLTKLILSYVCEFGL